MEYIDLRKVGKEGLKQIRSQVVRLKKMGKSGKEIEELTGVRQNRVSEIWTAYQREGEASFERKKYGRKPGTHMLLEAWEQEEIRQTVAEKIPEDFGIPGKLWTLGRTSQYIRKHYGKNVSERRVSDYMTLTYPGSVPKSRFLCKTSLIFLSPIGTYMRMITRL